MRTLSLPEWKVVHHDAAFKALRADITHVFTECHLDAQVIWDRDGPCVTFKSDDDAEMFLAHLTKH